MIALLVILIQIMPVIRARIQTLFHKARKKHDCHTPC
ncbi:hypothetical protein ACVWY5_005722 [Bradyrhizobium sp. USDA 3256]